MKSLKLFFSFQKSLQTEYDEAFVPFCIQCQNLLDQADWSLSEHNQLTLTSNVAINCVAEIFGIEAVLGGSVKKKWDIVGSNRDTVMSSRPKWADEWLELGVVSRHDIESKVAGFIVKVFSDYTKVREGDLTLIATLS